MAALQHAVHMRLLEKALAWHPRLEHYLQDRTVDKTVCAAFVVDTALGLGSAAALQQLLQHALHDLGVGVSMPPQMAHFPSRP